MNYQEDRPWGNFKILYQEEKLKIKRIIVRPGMRLSLQSHRHRSENWVIIQGTALVTLDGKDIPCTANQSLFIPAGAKHRMANQGKDEVIFIEVQTGSYLGEDDIIRYQDDFHRK